MRQQAVCCIFWMNLLLAAWQQLPLKVCFSLVHVLHPAGSICYINVFMTTCFFPLGMLFIISLPPGIHNTHNNNNMIIKG